MSTHVNSNPGAKALIAGVIGALLSLGAVADDWTIKGEARSPSSGDLLYTEYHYLTVENDTIQRRQVDYVRPDSTRFAQKILNHDTDYQYVPSLDWQDDEAETTIIGELSGNRYTQSISGPDRNETETATLSDPEKVAFDAAFDQYLIDHIDRLLDNGRLNFDFLSLGANRTYSFRANVKAQNNGEAVIEVGPQSAVIRWFVDPIELTYDIEQQRLLRFSGVTNFRRDGDLISAEINYEYQ